MALTGYLLLDLLAFIVIRVVNILVASNLLQVVVEPDNFMFCLCGLPADLLPMLKVDLVTQGALSVITDT